MYVESNIARVEKVDLPHYVESLCNVIQALQEPNLNDEIKPQVSSMIHKSRIYLASQSAFFDSQLWLPQVKKESIQSREELLGCLGEVTGSMANLITHYLMVKKFDSVFNQNQLGLITNLKSIFFQLQRINDYVTNRSTQP